MKEVAAKAKAIASERAEVDEQLDRTLATLPNLPLDSSPLEEEVVREWGEAGKTGRDHLDLLDGLVDMESGAKLSGSRFAYLRGPLVMLELALVRWALEVLTGHGFEPVVPPVLVREEALYGTGFLPDTEQQIYRVADDDLYLVGTSEVALAGMHAKEVLDLSAGPKRYAGWSSCFRREAGSYGKDTRGIIRVHWFDKVEMFSFCRPEETRAEHLRLLQWEEEFLQALELPYRVVDIAAGDLGTSATRKYDIEAWFPTQGTYRELTSTSDCTTFQARRLNIRYRDDDGKPQPAATLNGTLCAIARTIACLLEVHQRADGSVYVPKALRPWLGGVEELTPGMSLSAAVPTA
jgi:seryl-tRNA synthetase